MRVIGFMILRNGVKMDYPFQEAIRSALPICTQFHIAVGQSEDETKERLYALQDSRLVIHDSEWDLTLRRGGAVLAEETNKLLSYLPEADWFLYLQADEVLHEEDYKPLEEAMYRWKENPRVEGLVFDYLHFYGSYRWVGASRKWYRREVRAIKPLPDIHAYRDAQGFRRNGRKLRVKSANARIFHYGWVRPPERQREKLSQLHRYWHEDSWVEKTLPEKFVYDGNDLLAPFTGTHPAVMKERIATETWEFSYDPVRVQLPLRTRLLHWIEEKTGWRPGEFRNYRLI
ncbi:MAG: glycosyltransferase family 2 protein [Bacteroidia bacterium]|nr:glycosyltransferase family 2 protein [Bacteroidia bacterium]